MAERSPPGPISPLATREIGLRRVSALTRWVVVGAVALVGALAGFVAQAKPGRTTADRARSGTPAAPHSAAGSAGGSASPAAPPAAPAPAPAPPGAVPG